MNRAEVLKRIEGLAVVSVVRAPSAETALAAVCALLAGGLSVFEITLTVPGALDVIEELVARLGDRAVIGAGTVLSADSALDATKAGAAFVVSPGLDLPTVEAMRARDVPVFPGALPPSEILTAWDAGADVVKSLPCSALGGAKYLAQLRGPFRSGRTTRTSRPRRTPWTPRDPRLAWLLARAPQWRDAREKTLVFVAHRDTLEMLRTALSHHAQLASGVFQGADAGARRATSGAVPRGRRAEPARLHRVRR